ncbi:MAG: Calx-beta domain-containing protein [Pseudomonadota bacterium]
MSSVISIANTSSSAEEFQSFVTFSVTLDTPPSAPVSVNFRTLYDGTATNADLKNTLTSTSNNGTSDPNNGTLTFEPGQTALTLRVEADRDSLDEFDEHIVVELYEPLNASFEGGTPVLRSAGAILDDDGGGSNTSVFVGDPVIVEGDSGTSIARFDVALSRPQGDSTTFSYATFDGSARAGQDYTATSGELTLGAGQTLGTVDVPVLGDTTAESAEWFALAVRDLAGRIHTGGDGVGYAEIRDTDASALPEISVQGSASIEEVASFIRFNVSLSEPSFDIVTVNYRTLNDQSASNFDLSSVMTAPANTGVLTFAPGQTELSVLIEPQDDTLDERDEAITLELFDPGGATFGADQLSLRATGFILDDDGDAGERDNTALFVGDPVLVEGDQGVTFAQFDIALSRPATEPTTFDYSTQDGAAVAGEDYLARAGTLVFEPGQDRATIEVPVLGGRVPEPTEWFGLAVTSPAPAGGIALDGGVGTAEIRDTDSWGGPTLSLSGDTTVEEFNQFLNFVVSLSEPAPETVTVNYRALFDGTLTNSDLDNTLTSTTSNGTAAPNNGQITFAPGETTATFLIEAESDALNEADEALTVELYDPVGATFGPDLPVLRASGVVLDDDGDDLNNAVFVGDPVLIEGNSGTNAAQFDIVLSRPATAPTSFSFATQDGTAFAGRDYVAREGEVVFETGQTRANVQVEVRGDTAPEATEWFGLRLTPSAGPPVQLADSVGYAEIRDTETSPRPEISVSGDSTIEEFGNFMRFRVSLSEPSAAPVTVEYEIGFGTADRSDLYPAQDEAGRVTFAAGETTHDILVEANGDNLSEADESIHVALSAPTNAVFGGAVSSVAAGGFVFDASETAARGVYGPPAWVREPANAGERVGLTVEISEPSAQPVTLAVNVASASATPGEDFRLISDEVTFQPYETRATVDVEILQDEVSEGTEYVSFALRPVDPTMLPGPSPTLELTLEDRAPAVTIFGTSGDDTSYGTQDGEVFNGFPGNDRLTGLGGDDTINGGDGEDTAVYAGAQYSYTLTLSPGQSTITNRADAIEGTDRLNSIELLDFDTEIPSFEEQGSFPLAIFENVVAAAPEDLAQVAELFIAYFDRAPDALGLYYWVDQVTLGFTREEMAANFFQQPEPRALYAGYLDATGAPTDLEAFVRQVFENVLGRSPDAKELSHWAGELQSGDVVTVPLFILALLNDVRAAGELTAQTLIDQQYLDDRQDLGLYYAAIKGMSDFDDARDLALYDGTPGSVSTARIAFDDHYQQAIHPSFGDFLTPLVGVIETPFE